MYVCTNMGFVRVIRSPFQGVSRGSCDQITIRPLDVLLCGVLCLAASSPLWFRLHMGFDSVDPLLYLHKEHGGAFFVL